MRREEVTPRQTVRTEEEERKIDEGRHEARREEDVRNVGRREQMDDV